MTNPRGRLALVIGIALGVIIAIAILSALTTVDVLPIIASAILAIVVALIMLRPKRQANNS